MKTAQIEIQPFIANEYYMELTEFFHGQYCDYPQITTNRRDRTVFRFGSYADPLSEEALTRLREHTTELIEMLSSYRVTITEQA